MNFIFIAIIILFILEYNHKIDTKKFVTDSEPYFRFLMEDDYKFLLNLKYGNDVDIEKLFSQRIRNGMITILFVVFLFLSKMSFVYFIAAIIVGFVVYKMPYTQLKKFYKNNLYKINLMLPYYLKGLEILIQHYTVPVALARSIETAPEMFKPGLEKLVARIEEGDASVDPYMDFAKEYPVRDSMRMMRLLYRLGLGSQEKKQERLMMFSRTVSNLQNKARETKYKERLNHMESQTMVMLVVTGVGVMLIILISMMMMFSS